MKAYVIYRKDYVRKDDSRGIYIRVLIGQKKKDYNLKISVTPEFWDEKNLSVKRKHFMALKYNLLIESELKRANDILLDFKIKEQSITFDEFEFRYKKIENGDSFLDFVKLIIEENKHKYADETLRSYNSYLTKLQKYKPDISFKEINSLEFSRVYERFMFTVLGNSQNTVRKSLSFIKTLLTEAKKRKFIQEVNFDFNIKKLPGTREYLLENEIKKLEETLHNRSLKIYQQRVLEYFLFACYTGLRYIDLKTLKYKHIIIKDIPDKESGKIHKKDFVMKLINKTQRSTGVVVEIPLIKKAKDLLGTGLPDDLVFNIPHNTNYNLYIKEVMEKAGIEKQISSHCARHTFATHCLTLGIPMEVVQKVLGHADIRTTQIYAKIVDSAKVEAMDKWENEM
ncbi:MAG: site-specific integrase [Chloroflexia bacterium]|nr:site-specific integrase [Chloroflexia bacterium]